MIVLANWCVHLLMYLLRHVLQLDSPHLLYLESEYKKTESHCGRLTFEPPPLVVGGICYCITVGMFVSIGTPHSQEGSEVNYSDPGVVAKNRVSGHNLTLKIIDKIGANSWS